jgi:hypothetical protein
MVRRRKALALVRPKGDFQRIMGGGADGGCLHCDPSDPAASEILICSVTSLKHSVRFLTGEYMRIRSARRRLSNADPLIMEIIIGPSYYFRCINARSLATV